LPRQEVGKTLFFSEEEYVNLPFESRAMAKEEPCWEPSARKLVHDNLFLCKK
jgi:hypothetical protein